MRCGVTDYAYPQEPNIVLIGGSAMPLDSNERVRFTHRLDATIKLLLGNRYEHFEPTERSTVIDGRELLVFEWKTFTKVAE
jgi:hypothetical protein